MKTKLLLLTVTLIFLAACSPAPAELTATAEQTAAETQTAAPTSTATYTATPIATPTKTPSSTSTQDAPGAGSGSALGRIEVSAVTESGEPVNGLEISLSLFGASTDGVTSAGFVILEAPPGQYSVSFIWVTGKTEPSGCRNPSLEEPWRNDLMSRGSESGFLYNMLFDELSLSLDRPLVFNLVFACE
jgi:hypothetical protein